MLHLATYFDVNYLSRGLTLFNSLKKYCEEFELYVVCLDEITLDYFLNSINIYPGLIPLSLNEIEEFDREFEECKKNRSTIEYYFTLSPCLPLYILKKYNLPHICTLDADMVFFSSPSIIFSYLEKYSVLITPHNFSKELKSFELYGLYNVSFQIFKNDTYGVECLEKWREQCINWCYDILEDGKYADQKYLDNWEIQFNGVCPIDIPGIGVAPWNINSYSVTFKENQLFVNDSKLICYHFHGLRIIDKHLVVHGMNKYGVNITKVITSYVYKPYIKSLLTFKLSNDSGIERHIISPQSRFETFFFQNNWYYYIAGLIFKKNYFSHLLSRSINFVRNRINRVRIS
jgi:hypothetical protein